MKIPFLSVCLSSGRIRIVLASTLLLFVVFVAFLNVKANSATVVTSILPGNKLDTFEQTQTNDTGTIRGHVTVSDGGLLEGLSVQVFGNDTFATIVDSSGNYTVANMPVGTYTLLFGAERITAENDPLSYYIPEYYNNHLVGSDYATDSITVTTNSVITIDAELQFGAVITGTVTSAATGEPLKDITVIAVESGTNSTYDDSTDANGQYKLPRLISGSYKVCFVLVGSPYYKQCATDSRLNTVTAGKFLHLDMTMADAATIRGRVTSDQTGKGIPGVTVSMYNNSFECFTCYAHTDIQGFYQITGLAAGDYTIYFDGMLAFGTEDGKRTGPFFPEYYNNQPTVGDLISVTAGTVITIDVGLTSALNMIGEIVSPIDFTDPNIFDPDIFVYNEAGQGVGLTRMLENSNQFIVYGLQPGSYRLAFSLSYAGEMIYPEYYNDKFTFEDADPITVTQGVASNLVVTVTPKEQTALQLVTSAALTDVLVLKSSDSPGSYASLRYSNNDGGNWQSLISEPWITATVKPDRDFVTTLVPRGNETFPTRIIRASKTDYLPANNSQIYRTGDFGATSWATFEPAVLPNCAPAYKHTYLALLNSPVDPVRIYLYAACFYYYPDYPAPRPQLFTSNNAGIDWQEVTFPAMLATFPERFFVSPVLPNRIYTTQSTSDGMNETLAQSDDAGVTWSTALTVPVSYLEFDWYDSTKVYGIEDKDAPASPLRPFGKFDVYRYTGKRSNDGGATWVDWQEQPCRTSFLKFIALQQPNTLLMRCLQGLYRSSNGGDHWEKLPETVDELIAVDYGNRNRIFGQRQGLLYASRDQGSTWTALGDWHSSMWLPFVSR